MSLVINKTQKKQDMRVNLKVTDFQIGGFHNGG